MYGIDHTTSKSKKGKGEQQQQQRFTSSSSQSLRSASFSGAGAIVENAAAAAAAHVRTATASSSVSEPQSGPRGVGISNNTPVSGSPLKPEMRAPPHVPSGPIRSAGVFNAAGGVGSSAPPASPASKNPNGGKPTTGDDDEDEEDDEDTYDNSKIDPEKITMEQAFRISDLAGKPFRRMYFSKVWSRAAGELDETRRPAASSPSSAAAESALAAAVSASAAASASASQEKERRAGGLGRGSGGGGGGEAGTALRLEVPALGADAPREIDVKHAGAAVRGRGTGTSNGNIASRDDKPQKKEADEDGNDARRNPFHGRPRPEGLFDLAGMEEYSEEFEQRQNWLRQMVDQWLCRFASPNAVALLHAKYKIKFRSDGSNFNESLKALVAYLPSYLKTALPPAVHDFKIAPGEMISYVLGDVDFIAHTSVPNNRSYQLGVYLNLKIGVLQCHQAAMKSSRHSRVMDVYKKAMANFVAYRSGVLRSCGCLKFG